MKLNTYFSLLLSFQSNSLNSFYNYCIIFYLQHLTTLTVNIVLNVRFHIPSILQKCKCLTQNTKRVATLIE